MFEVKKDDAEQEECAEESGEEAGVPLGGDRERRDNQKNTNDIGTDGPARGPGRNGWEATEVVSVEEVLDAEGGDADCEQGAAEVAKEEHWVFGDREIRNSGDSIPEIWR
jgi:hypothetical protein